jgi:hypothetical protein
MAIPTVAEVQTGILKRLADPNGRVFTSSDTLEGFQEAHRRLKSRMLELQIPRSKKVVTYTLAAGTAELTPATAGITDFGDLIRLEERASGSSVHYMEMDGPVEELAQRFGGSSLGEFEWREDTFHFVAATTPRQLKITYFESSAPPSSGSIGIDDSFLFLATYGAAVIAPWKGYDERGDALMLQAVGRDGKGGYLYDLVSPMVRSLPGIQPAAYDLQRRGSIRRVAPYIAAPVGGSMSELIITGTIDGVNNVFTLNASPLVFQLFRNGQKMKQDLAFTRVDVTVTFYEGYIPQPGDVLEVYA